MKQFKVRTSVGNFYCSEIRRNGISFEDGIPKEEYSFIPEKRAYMFLPIQVIEELGVDNINGKKYNLKILEEDKKNKIITAQIKSKFGVFDVGYRNRSGTPLKERRKHRVEVQWMIEQAERRLEERLYKKSKNKY